MQHAADALASVSNRIDVVQPNSKQVRRDHPDRVMDSTVTIAPISIRTDRCCVGDRVESAPCSGSPESR